MRLSRSAVSLLLGSALFTLFAAVPPALHAQDGAGEETGEEAPEETGPKIEAPIKFNDRKSLIELLLPRDWKSEKVDESRNELGRWQWVVGEGDQAGAVAGVLTYKVPSAMRASLYRAAKGGPDIEKVEESLKSGDGWAEQRMIDPRGVTFIERYVEQHCAPFRTGFVDRVFNGHICRVAEGEFGGFFGWPNLTLTPSGGFMGMPATGRPGDMRVIDMYRRDGDKLTENWIFIDLLHFWMQQGVDVLERGLVTPRT